MYVSCAPLRVHLARIPSYMLSMCHSYIKLVNAIQEAVCGIELDCVVVPVVQGNNRRKLEAQSRREAASCSCWGPAGGLCGPGLGP